MHQTLHVRNCRRGNVDMTKKIKPQERNCFSVKKKGTK